MHGPGFSGGFVPVGFSLLFGKWGFKGESGGEKADSQFIKSGVRGTGEGIGNGCSRSDLTRMSSRLTKCSPVSVRDGGDPAGIVAELVGK